MFWSSDSTIIIIIDFVVVVIVFLLFPSCRRAGLGVHFHVAFQETVTSVAAARPNHVIPRGSSAHCGLIIPRAVSTEIEHLQDERIHLTGVNMKKDLPIVVRQGLKLREVCQDSREKSSSTGETMTGFQVMLQEEDVPIVDVGDL